MALYNFKIAFGEKRESAGKSFGYLILGYFGSGIAGYVTLINRLLSLNFFIFLMVGGLYVVPSILNYHKYLFVVTTITNNSDSERIQLERRVFGSYANSSPYNVTLNDALYLPSHSSIKASAADSVGSTAVLDLLQGTVRTTNVASQNELV